MKPPAYLHHSAKDLAYMVIAGRQIYLGKWQSPESHTAYIKKLAEWRANGGTLDDRSKFCVAEIAELFLADVERRGPSQRHMDRTVKALRLLVEWYGDLDADDFTPRHLKALRQHWLDERLPSRKKGGPERRLARQYINCLAQIIQRSIRYGVAEERVHPDTLNRLEAVRPLEKADAAGAPEWKRRDPVEVVPFINALWHAAPVIRDMALFQWWTGARPGEVTIIRPCDVNRDGDIWCYTPEHHKTEHLDKDRPIYIGPSAQEILRPYLLRPADAYCFTPAGKATPYLEQSYRQAIERACKKAGIPHWTPYQIRHHAGTRYANEAGAVAAQRQLGHAKLETTQNYIHDDRKQSEEVARRLG